MAKKVTKPKQIAKAPTTDITPSSTKKKEKSKPTDPATTPSPAVDPAETIFFFKETDAHGYLCQWYRSPFTTPSDGQIFSTAEQYTMYRKAIFFRDYASAAQILTTSNPRKVKALGRSVANFDAERWDEVKLAVVEEGNYLKFSQGDDLASIGIGDGEERIPRSLRGLLMETGERELVEASPFDRVWGIGYRAEEAVMGRRRKEWGFNLLGKALMNVRERLRREETEAAERDDE